MYWQCLMLYCNSVAKSSINIDDICQHAVGSSGLANFYHEDVLDLSWLCYWPCSSGDVVLEDNLAVEDASTYELLILSDKCNWKWHHLIPTFQRTCCNSTWDMKRTALCILIRQRIRVASFYKRYSSRRIHAPSNGPRARSANRPKHQ